MVTMATRDEEPIHDASELLLKLDCFLHELNECKSREYSFKFWRKSQDYESTRLMLISVSCCILAAEFYLISLGWRSDVT